MNVLPRVWFLGACRKVPRAAAVSPAPPTPAWLVPLGSFPSHPPGTGADRCRGNTTDSWVSPAQVTNLSASVHRPPTQQPLADWSHLISCRPMSSASPGILRSPQSPCRAAAIQTLSAVSRLVKPLALHNPQRRRVQAGSQANDIPPYPPPKTQKLQVKPPGQYSRSARTSFRSVTSRKVLNLTDGPGDVNEGDNEVAFQTHRTEKY